MAWGMRATSNTSITSWTACDRGSSRTAMWTSVIRSQCNVDLSVRSYRNGKVYYFDAEREQVVEKG